MTGRERLLRAASALAGGLWLAWDHARGHTPDEEPLPVVGACPECGRALGLMHVHDDHVIWCHDDPEMVLVTRLDGSDPCPIGGAQ